jgi:hypothetical protein
MVRRMGAGAPLEGDLMTAYETPEVYRKPGASRSTAVKKPFDLAAPVDDEELTIRAGCRRRDEPKGSPTRGR